MQRSFDFSSKKARLAIRFFTYGVMTISTILLTILAIYYAMGYRFNPNLEVEQGGIIEFRSEPSGAQITLDGQLTGRQTPNRTFAKAGEHTITMQLNGYREWSKKVFLQPGQLLWLDYTRFIPQSITTSPVREFANLTQILPSPDRKWLLLQETATDAHLLLADTSNDRSPAFTSLALPDAALSKKDGMRGALTLLEWDQSSRYALLRHDFGGTREFIRLDRSDPAAAVNVSTRFNMPIDDIHFGTPGGNIVFAKTGSVLRRIDISANTADMPFAEGVTQFSVQNSTVAFTATRGAEQVVGVSESGKEVILFTAPLDAPVRVAISEYGRHTYLAYSSGGTQGVVVRDPASSQSSSAEFKLDPSTEWLRFSPKGRFVLGGSALAWNGFDLETQRSFTTPGGFDRPVDWLDDFHFYSDSNGMLRVAEFDGQNSQDITGAAAGFAAVLTPNERAVLSVARTAHGSYVLQVSGLIN